MKNTWRYYINKEYYEFKSFKVYWAYRWYMAEKLEKNLVRERKGLNGGVERTIEDKPGLYSDSYKRSCNK